MSCHRSWQNSLVRVVWDGPKTPSVTIYLEGGQSQGVISHLRSESTIPGEQEAESNHQTVQLRSEQTRDTISCCLKVPTPPPRPMGVTHA